MDEMERLNSKLRYIETKKRCDKRRYWKVRMEVIKYLGGKCACGESDVSQLEIHHEPPLLRKRRPGGERIKEWRQIIAGVVPAKLCCHKCHINDEHNGNTNELKKVKV
jgi:hypothetical protein